MTHKWVEVTVRLIGDDYKQTVDMYSQRINYEYYYEIRPDMVAQIVAVVNGFPIPAPNQIYQHSTWPIERT
jgi:hypothetical protein